ncbi:MAG TPA: hypothetical protein PKD55_00310 [Bellilinea sp.]|nr:hypothetical protein [Bellilinea sp.]
MKKKLDKLLFENPVFESGQNMTVRRGDKWFDRDGEIVEVCDLEGNPLFESRILSTWNMPFDMVPAVWLKLEHDQASRTRAGLLEEMQKIYEGFQPDENVTVVFFDVP